MDPDTDLFNTLEKAPAGRGSLTAIVSGTEKCLLILLPWHKASSDNPHLEQIITKIVNNCILYIQAIDTSIKIAGDGYSLASDAVDICTHVVDPETDPEDLREFIDDMKEKAREAHQDCKEVSEKFREVQAGIFEMSKALPKEVLESQEGDKSRFIRFYSAVSKAANKILPKPPADLKEAMAQLQLAAVNIGDLHRTVEDFVTWWAQMDTQLMHVNTNSVRLNPEDKPNKLRIKTIRKSWERIRNDYGDYKLEITKLQGYYPADMNVRGDAVAAT